MVFRQKQILDKAAVQKKKTWNHLSPYKIWTRSVRKDGLKSDIPRPFLVASYKIYAEKGWLDPGMVSENPTLVYNLKIIPEYLSMPK